MRDSHGAIGATPGGSCHTPGAGDGMTKPMSASKPSPSRTVTTASAASRPTAIPASLARPPGMAANAVA